MARKSDKTNPDQPPDRGDKAESKSDVEIHVMGKIERQLARLPSDASKIRVMEYFTRRFSLAFVEKEMGGLRRFMDSFHKPATEQDGQADGAPPIVPAPSANGLVKHDMAGA